MFIFIMVYVLADALHTFASKASCLAVSSNPRSDCFRLEQQLPGGLSSSHWINVPFPRRTIFVG